jgi:hypothetical protein
VNTFFFLGREQVGRTDLDTPPAIGTVVELEQDGRRLVVTDVVMVVGNGAFYKVILGDKVEPKIEPGRYETVGEDRVTAAPGN